jgi:hypothetical protein
MSEDTKTVFIMKRSAAGEVNKKLMSYFNKIPLQIDEAQEAMIHFFVDEDVIDAWSQVFDKLRTKQELYLPDKTRKEFMRYLNMQASKLFSETFDTTSRLLVRGATDMDNELNWFLNWPACLVSNFKETGCYGCIEGVPRTGKTSLACTLMVLLYESFNFQIITNARIDSAPPYIHYVQKLSQLVLKMDELERWVCVLDETATFAYKKLALSAANIDFENLARFVGKLGGRLLMITHNFAADIPTQLQLWMTERYKKLEKTRMRVDLEGRNYKAHLNVCGLPDTELKFITEDITSLQFDISIKRVLDRIQDGISVADAVGEQLIHTNTDVILQLRKAHPDWTHEQIAEQVGCSRPNVTKILQRH